MDTNPGLPPAGGPDAPGSGARPRFCTTCGQRLDGDGRCPRGHRAGDSTAAQVPVALDIQQRLAEMREGPRRKSAEVGAALAAGAVAAILVMSTHHSGLLSQLFGMGTISVADIAITQTMLRRGNVEHWQMLAVDAIFGAVYFALWNAATRVFFMIEPLVALAATYVLCHPGLWDWVARRYVRPPRTAEGLRQALADLDALVGMTALKGEIHSLVGEMQVEQEHSARTSRPYRPTLHCLLMGPPGTGKTTVARLIGRIYFELGLLADGHLVEAGREDLVGEYVGHTAPKVRAAVAKARGGVLFIDEAYTLLSGRGQTGADFGKEALETLLRHLENARGEFCCILAGYEDEMHALFRVNPGLQSRIPHAFHFQDYSAPELTAIAGGMAQAEGLTLAEDALPLLTDHFSRYGRGTDGNARLARNVLEAARKERSRRIGAAGLQGADLATITRGDVAAALRGARSPEALERALAELDAMIGLRQVKEEVHGLVALMQRDRQQLGERTYRPTLHMAFLGPPGTGKTSVARLLGRILFHMGLLDEPEVVELNGATFVGEHQGQTGARVQEAVERARGGVLFIDEAYALLSNGEFGQQAVNALLVPLENDRGRFCCVLAGYPAEMEKLFDVNPGLRRRLPNVIHFTDYAADELLAITARFAADAGYALADDARAALLEHYARHGRGQEGNGGLARKLFEDALRAQAVRLAAAGGEGDRRTLTGADVAAATRGRARGGGERSREDLAAALAELDSLVGLQQVKREIRGLVDLMRFNEARAREGGRSAPAPTLHVAFVGPPGTGKTTVARLLGRIYFQLGLLADGHLEEQNPRSLIAGYVGQTAPRVEEAVRLAQGGVLFIDEAYSLGDGEFGKEAVDTLIKLLEDARDKFCCVVAGYDEQMRRFFALNPGFASRVPTMVHFADYSASDLLDITRKEAAAADFRFETEAEALLQDFYAAHGRGAEGNGRLARNVFEAARMAKAARFAAEGPSGGDLGAITAADVAQALGRVREQLATTMR